MKVRLLLLDIADFGGGALDEALDNELKSILTDYTSEFVASQ